MNSFTNYKNSRISIFILILWAILMLMPYYNIIFDIKTGGWFRDENSSFLDRYIKFFIIFSGLIVFFFKKFFTRSIYVISKNILNLRILVFIMLFGYILSSFVNNRTFELSNHYRFILLSIFFAISISSIIKPVNFNLLHKYFWGYFLISIIILTYIFIFIFDGSDLQRFGFTYVDPNYLSAILNISLISLFTTIFNKNSFFQFVLFFALILLVLYFKILTYSSGGFISLLIMTITAIFFRYNNSDADTQLITYFFFFLVVVSVLLFFNDVIENLFPRLSLLTNSSGDIYAESVESRISQYDSFFLLLKNNFDYFIGISIEKIPIAVGQDLHNSFLRPLVAGGFLPFISFILINFICVKYYIKSLTITKKLRQKNNYNLTLVIFCSYLGWIIQSLTLPFETLELFWFFFVFSVVLFRSTQIEIKLCNT